MRVRREAAQVHELRVDGRNVVVRNRALGVHLLAERVHAAEVAARPPADDDHDPGDGPGSGRPDHGRPFIFIQLVDLPDQIQGSCTGRQ